MSKKEEKIQASADYRRKSAFFNENADTIDTNNICPRCNARVYFNERAPPFLSQTFHARCFKCFACHRTLKAGLFLDHNSCAYCEPCYDKLFAGNRKEYSMNDDDSQAGSEIDRSDPLARVKSKNGKIDIRRFSKIHNIELERNAKKASNKYFQNAKLRGYILTSNNNASLVLRGRMQFIHERVRKRMHQMVVHQCYQMQRKIVERLDAILYEELMEFEHRNSNKVPSKESNGKNKYSEQEIQEIKEIGKLLETDVTGIMKDFDFFNDNVDVEEENDERITIAATDDCTETEFGDGTAELLLKLGCA